MDPSVNPNSPQITPGKILVIDDDPTLIKLLETILREQGYEVRTAGDGIEGLSQCQAFQPDLIILDILMPRMDGYTFVLELKKTQDLKKVPIIILTSRDSMQDIFGMEGINDYIVKPFKRDELLRKIRKRLQSKEKEKRILVVDDEADIVSVIENRLRNSGYDVLTAFDGLNGLQIAQREIPDLMVLDIMLPKLNGYNICRMLKFDEKYRTIPIILLTALSREQDRNVGREVGADAFLTKPYDGRILLQTIKELLWD